MTENINAGIPLGKQVGHSETYDPSHLFPVARREARKSLGLADDLPFSGPDIWNAYELSWLDSKGKPCVALGEITFPCTSENIIESKSLKLYLNSFNLTRFTSTARVKEIIREDLSRVAGAEVEVKILTPEEFTEVTISAPEGSCIDDLELEEEINAYRPTANYLSTGPEETEEELYTNLLRTNCPVTGQPDWATVIINYRGKAIDQRGLLRYIISFRQHEGFHENCVERIFMDILNRCAPARLTVYARFTRRGGLDINPYRTTHAEHFVNLRLARQ
ncbi:NADPH-dependent 7-cyano-7-deazaguanine reductase QueF [Desulfotalea psychrophila]|uniref:NADPH-dependent 7-cyano-7-deazaguanine reductase n=1 Tax=Desulfotalea psychrophila (strain LSv54 / DSM 12343) TaxID=177439 RepID=QUEF_DESPS|nr:NADPH-dependent 7-cyano-7-deazaguanine reductase QueF [Desulfotalea psychrophila]Q6ARX8.1 RecName: Full=NADPH-dependent 7-cyano-7-deazaguanine reductase; AltName: Full=7-cyano-7-carbaguanine reductase; AltName: Full=NADPH-dependent nitrile oxidoreductase; AltName: Full=PreQ(0) reductase [Desulfotalea psychrophila LSv54]CAG34897.1 conserved hypothetical protein [Desulfotalea psychrophila LSv54]